MASIPLSVSSTATAGSSCSLRRTPISLSVTATASAASSLGLASSRHVPLSVSANAAASSSLGLAAARRIALSVSATATASASLGSSHNTSFTASASAAAVASSSVALAVTSHPLLSPSSSAAASSAVALRVNRAYRISVSALASASSGLAPTGNRGLSTTALATASSSVSLLFSKRLTSSATAVASSAASLTVKRSISVTAAAVASSAVAPGSSLIAIHVTATAVAGSSVSLRVGGRPISASAVAASFVSVTVLQPDGTVIGGGGTLGGPRSAVWSGASAGYPATFAETPCGDIVCANGIDPMVVWSPLAGSARLAGVLPPATAPTLGGDTVGTITGRRVAYVRFVDSNGGVSNLSPASNDVVMGFDALIQDITVDHATGVITVWSPGHGVSAPTSLVFRNVGGLEILNGTQTVAPLDADRLVVGSAFSATNLYTEGGSWTYGVGRVVYGSVPTTSAGNVVRRQILRNLEGNLDVLYVDVDTTDLLSSSFTSTRSDQELAACEAVPLTAKDGLPFANRNAAPPTHKGVIVSHLGRVFAAGDVPYADGCVKALPGLATVEGVGTAWNASSVGRRMTIDGCPGHFTVTGLAGQVATLDRPVVTSVGPFSKYVLAPHHADRKTVYYSEPGLPECWPEWNAFALPEDGDTVTGMFTNGSYLYVVHERSVYRVVFQGTPSEGGTTFLAARRGCVNHRCVVQSEGTTFMLDEAGVHAFGTDDSDKHVSDPVHTAFRGGGDSDTEIDWSADRRLWHGSADPAYETVRWFVSLVGRDKLDTALCLNYRTGAWWLERYPFAVTSSATAAVNGSRRAMAGTEARRVVCLWSGPSDLPPASGTTTGTATSATSTTVVDTTADFASSLAGSPVAIVSGTGAGQTRTVSDNSSVSLSVVEPWAVTPDATSVYAVGGVPWHWNSPWYSYAEDEYGNPRDVKLAYSPTPAGRSIGMEFYYDHSDTPATWSFTRDDDGVSVSSGSPSVRFDTSPTRGLSVFRSEGHTDAFAYGDSLVKLKLSGVQHGSRTRVYGLTVNGAESNP